MHHARLLVSCCIRCYLGILSTPVLSRILLTFSRSLVSDWPLALLNISSTHRFLIGTATMDILLLRACSLTELLDRDWWQINHLTAQWASGRGWLVSVVVESLCIAGVSDLLLLKYTVYGWSSLYVSYVHNGLVLKNGFFSFLSLILNKRATE